MASPVHRPKSKFYPQVDVEWPPDGSNVSPQGVEMQSVPDQSINIQRSPPRPSSHFSPRIITNPEEVDIDYGLGSKFKNVRLADEFSVYVTKPFEDRYSFTSNQGSHAQSALSPKPVVVVTETGKEQEQMKDYGKGYILSVLLTVFSVEFAGALEIVYITPYFLKLDLNEWVDATFWMFPLVFTTLIKTPISILASHLKCQRPTLFVMMWLSVIGCFIFTSVDEITLKDVIPWEQRRILMTWLGLVAFCFIDVANEMITVVQNRVIEENEQMADSLNSKASVAGSIAKMFGYFCGSLQALKISKYEVLERNMDTCFLLAGILMFVSMALCFFFQSAPTKGVTGSLLPRFKNLKLSHFLPSFKKAFGASRKMKLILSSHFFAAGNIVMLSVYATSWVGQNVLKGDPLADSIDSKTFEEGVSWGSLGLMVTSVIILIVGFALHKMVRNAQKKKFKILHIVSQLLSSLALFLALFLGDLNSVFLVIPLTGLAFQTFHAVPEILADILENEEGITTPGSYRRLLDFTFFYAQVLMWLVVPLVFIFFPDRDDNQWGMLVAASSGCASVVFALFI